MNWGCTFEKKNINSKTSKLKQRNLSLLPLIKNKQYQKVKYLPLWKQNTHLPRHWKEMAKESYNSGVLIWCLSNSFLFFYQLTKKISSRVCVCQTNPAMKYSLYTAWLFFFFFLIGPNIDVYWTPIVTNTGHRLGCVWF